jgi:hypothetical protein
MEIKRSGSQPSGKGPADWFTSYVLHRLHGSGSWIRTPRSCRAGLTGGSAVARNRERLPCPNVPPVGRNTSYPAAPAHVARRACRTCSAMNLARVSTESRGTSTIS